MTRTGKRRNGVQRTLLSFPEPRLRFGFEQALEDPKDGLLLFGPPDKPLGLRYGVIGLPAGIARFEAWAKRIVGAIDSDPDVSSSVGYPGFQTLFRTEWDPTPRVRLEVDEKDLRAAVRLTDSHQRVFNTVELFAEPIIRWVKEEDPKVALWFVVIPEKVWQLCRPRSTISKAEGVTPGVSLTHKRALRLLEAPDLFEDYNLAAEKHLYENHFHNQLKAKLLDCEAVTQIVRETTIAPHDFLDQFGKPKRKLQDEATIAWNLSTTIYYKAGGKPWNLADIREGVCYVGLVFKRTNNPKDAHEACCGAQMFLHTGEGMVFKGSVGPWASDKPGEFHLSKEKAAEIVKKCVDAYTHWHKTSPQEGFHSAAPNDTKVAGIQIRRPNDVKLFREGRRAVLRGLGLKIDHRNAFLWTSGYVPKLQTYPGREVPTPLKVRVVFGNIEIVQVLEDILALTKLNFNTCIYGDGVPVTLRFADDVGEILTAIPSVSSKPLPFRHYL